MPAIAREWYNLNCSRSWPLDERATGISDAGDFMSDQLIADLHIRFPSTAGPRAFIAGLVVTDRLVSVVIQACEGEESAGPFVALGSVTLPKPVDVYRAYPVQAIYPGVGGWIVFGPGIVDVTGYNGRFSSPTQTLLTTRTARAYRPLPISGVGRSGADTRLTGVVGLSGGNDIEIVKECLEIPSYLPPPGQECDEEAAELRNVIVFRLKDKSGSADERNVLDLYRGPCGARPESRTCEGAEPIEFVGPIQPDCCGNITIEFRGCADLTKIESETIVDELGDPVSVEEMCGAMIDCAVQIEDTCSVELRLPDAEGNLPNDFGTLCLEESSDIPDTPVEPTPEPAPDIEESVSIDDMAESGGASEELPFVDFFETDDYYTVVSGEFGYRAEPGDRTFGTEAGAGTAYRNVAIWEDHWDILYRRAEIQFTMQAGPLGALHNAALVFGCREVGIEERYWVAEVDWDGFYDGRRTFRLARFVNGQSTQIVAEGVLGVSLGVVYRISVDIVPALDNPTQDAWVRPRLLLENGTTFNDLSWIRINGLVTEVSHFGMQTMRAITRFHRFSVANSGEV